MKILRKSNKKQIFLTVPPPLQQQQIKNQWITSISNKQKTKIISLPSTYSNHKDISNINSFLSHSVRPKSMLSHDNSIQNKPSAFNTPSISRKMKNVLYLPTKNTIELSSILVLGKENNSIDKRKQRDLSDGYSLQSCLTHSTNRRKSNKPYYPLMGIKRLTLKPDLNKNKDKLEEHFKKIKPKKRKMLDLNRDKKINPFSEEYTTDEIVQQAFYPVNSAIETEADQHKRILKHQLNTVISTAEFPIADNYSPQFRLLAKYSKLNECDTYNNIKTEEIEDKEERDLKIIGYIRAKYLTCHRAKMNTNLESQDDTINLNNQIKTRRQKVIKWKRVLINAAMQFNRLRISMGQFMKLKPNNKEPYDHGQSYNMFQEVRKGDKIAFKNYIQKNRLLLLTFDYSRETVLHWMAKRNLYDWISMTVNNGANVNARDSTGRTPLHLAVVNRNIDSVMILLYEMANPLIKDNLNKKPGDLTQDFTMVHIFQRVIMLYALHSMKKISSLSTCIKTGLVALFNDDFKLEFTQERFLITDKNPLSI